MTPFSFEDGVKLCRAEGLREVRVARLSAHLFRFCSQLLLFLVATALVKVGPLCL
jgi:hypothetical protein